MSSQKQDHSTAGLGDPFWYEWSVGQTYVIDMLSPDSDITSVTLQQSGPKGLDDVVVHFASGNARFIQVKHTRVEDTLTFGDLVSASDNEVPLLKQIADCWDAAAKTTRGTCEAWLLTNRNAGVRAASAGDAGAKITRPALAEFLEMVGKSLPTIATLDDIKLEPAWMPAWNDEWLPQLAGLGTAARKLQFMRAFTIRPSEQGLDELKIDLINRLGAAFGVSPDVAQGLLARLDSALREWATSSRGGREAITVERAYEVLALRGESPVGEHSLPPPAPFFPSRVAVVNEVADLLSQRVTPVVFLCGEPGSGKTAVVSSLANHREPVLDLRFHAYRPITPENQLLPADAGATTTSRALWSDLLLQVRELARGRLAKLRVPIHSDMLTTNTLRKEVLRIANLLGEERQKPVVIAIDGIDHAARAGSSIDSLLTTLVPPDQTPQYVVFLISGQPSASYGAYPSWLRCPTAGVTRVDLRGLDISDTQALIAERMPRLDVSMQNTVARDVFARCSGHTLATVFAVEEAANCTDIQRLPEILDSRGISMGVEAYYEAIWKAAARAHTFDASTMTRLAACLSLSPARSSAALVANVMEEGSFAGIVWADVLRLLQPLVIEEASGFRVFHNDVRVFLLRLVRSNDLLYRTCASRIADYFLAQRDPRPRHDAAQDLLGIAHRYSDQARIFTPTYVIEGYAIGQTLEVLTAHALVAAAALAKADRDWDLAQEVGCGLRTLVQLRASLQWRGIEGDADDNARHPLGAAPVRPAERVVVSMGNWNTATLTTALRDIEQLLDFGEQERATAAFRRWFVGLTPVEVLAACKAATAGRADAHDAEESRSTLGALLGRVSLRTATSLHVSEKCESDKGARAAEASYAAGILMAAVNVVQPRHFRRALRRVRIYFLADFQELLERLLEVRAWRRVALALAFLDPSAGKSSWPFRIQAAALAALTGNARLHSTWVAPIFANRSAAVAAAASASDHNAKGTTGAFPTLTWLAVLLGHEETSREPSSIREDLEIAYRGRQRDERSDCVVSQVLFAAATLGRIVRNARSAASGAPCDPDTLVRILANLMGGGHGARGYAPHGFAPIAKSLVEGIVDATKGSRELESVVHQAFLAEVTTGTQLGMFLEVGWRTLVRHGHAAELRTLAISWIGPTGRAWREPVADRHELVGRFTTLLDEIGETEIAKDARDRLRWAATGYTGHKEYALNEPLEWFVRLVRLRPACWSAAGLDLLALSKEASRAGDNRMATSVEAAVVAAACAEGPGAVARLLRVEGDWISPADLAFTKGLVEFVGCNQLSELDLNAVWAFCTGQLNWQSYRDGELLAEVRDAIVLAAQRQMIPNLSDKMQSVAPAEFAAKAETDRGRVAEDDAALLRLDELSALEAMRSAVGVARAETSAGWRQICHVLARLKRERPSDTSESVALAWHELTTSGYRWAWSFDGRNRVYRPIVGFVNASERWQSVRGAVSYLEQEVPEYRVSALAENIDTLCLAEAELSGEASLLTGLQRLLRTQEAWATGAGQLDSLAKPTLPAGRDVDGWPAVFVESLTGLLRFDEQGYVQAALCGLYRLLSSHPNVVPLALELIDRANEEVRRRFMLICEPLASLPGSNAVRAWLERALDDSHLDTALSAWLALRAHQRATGNDVREWPAPGDSTESLILQVVSPLLERPTSTKGLFTTAARPASSFMKFLASACQDQCEDINAAFGLALREIPSPGKRAATTRNRIGGDMVGVRDPEVERLMTLLRVYERRGRFRGVSLPRLAQALVPAADPYVFLRTPAPLDVEATWPVDESLERMLADRKATEFELAALVSAGIPADRKLLAGSIRTYSRREDVAVYVDHVVRHAPAVHEQRPFVLNGRSAFVFDEGDLMEFDKARDQEWLTRMVGGLLMFADGTVDFFPAQLWTDLFDWRPMPNNPLVWTRSGREVAWFERRLGPFRQIYPGDYVYRQPMLARWTCDEREWERIASLLPQPPVRSFRLERGHLDKSE